MSGILEETVDNIAAIGGNITSAIVLGGATLVGLSVLGVYKGTKEVLLGAKEVLSGAKDLTKESVIGLYQGISSAIHTTKAMIENRKEYNALYNKYKTDVEKSAEKTKEYIEKALTVSCKTDEEKKNYIKKIDKLSNDEKIQFANNLFKYNFYKEKIDSLHFMADEENISLGVIEEKIFSVDKIDNIEEKIKMLELIFNEMKDLFNKKGDNYEGFERIKTIFVEIESKTETPISLFFSNELREYIKQNKKHDDKLFEYLEIMDEVEKYRKRFYKLDFVKGCDECINLLASIDCFSSDEEISMETKYTEVNIRYRVLKNVVYNMEKKNEEILKRKNSYDDLYTKICNLSVFLSIKKPIYSFSEKTTDEEIDKLNQILLDLTNKAMEKATMEHVRKSIRDITLNMGYTFLYSKSISIKSGVIYQDFYSLERGNVLVVTTDNKGRVNYRVSGVKFEGINEDKASIVASMQKFCSIQKEFTKMLRERNINMKVKEVLAPSEKYAVSIELPKEISTEKMQFLRNERLMSNMRNTAQIAREVNL